jgi:tRNA U38,U39,U40 pseudouridine synthase TruA
MALADLVALLETARPSSAGPAAPACGLYLLRVEYDGLDFEAVGGSGQDE